MQKEYQSSLDELKSAINSKKYADIRTEALLAIDIIENNFKSSSNTKENVCSIIRLFYNECFLVTLEDVWDF